MSTCIKNICIDFGTSNTVISYMENNIIKQINDDYSGQSLIPSSIYFNDSVFSNNKKINDLIPFDDYFIGYNANNSSFKDSQYFFYEFKRFLGISEKTKHIYNDFLQRYQYNYIYGSDVLNFSITKNDNKLKFSVIDLVKLYFNAIYIIIKNQLNIIGNIDIILTCPAYFNDLQRSQLKIGVEKSNFKIYKIFNEPTAAVIYYINHMNNINNPDNTSIEENEIDTKCTRENIGDIGKKIIENGNNIYIVYDIGGGTTDVTVVRYMNDDNICEVIDTDGNNSLGGIDIDELIREKIYEKYNIDYDDAKWKHKTKKIAEDIKIKLTFNKQCNIFQEDVPIKNNNNINIVDSLTISFTRHEFDNIIEHLSNKLLEPFIRIYEKYKTNNIVLIGGPNKIPLIFNKINIITNNSAIIIDDKNNNVNIYKTIVSEGGCLLFNYIKNKNLYILDIIPMNIGICDGHNNMITMIEKNKKIPITIEKTFTTNYDCQRIIDVEIFEGSNHICNDNVMIGSYQICNVPPQKKGTIIIKLKFSINTNGILNISISGSENISECTKKNDQFKVDNKIKIIPTSLRDDLLAKLLNRKKENKI
jgi:molecular chaperone HscA